MITEPKQLKKEFKLEVRQAIYVPSTTDADKKITKKQFDARVNEVETYLSKMFGGKTSVKSEGGYYSSDKKKMIDEDVIQVFSFATKEDYNKHKDKLIEKIKFWAIKWKQESIGYEIEDDLYYISQK